MEAILGHCSWGYL